jgi:hypothetical protein
LGKTSDEEKKGKRAKRRFVILCMEYRGRTGSEDEMSKTDETSENKTTRRV